MCPLERLNIMIEKQIVNNCIIGRRVSKTITHTSSVTQVYVVEMYTSRNTSTLGLRLACGLVLLVIAAASAKKNWARNCFYYETSINYEYQYKLPRIPNKARRIEFSVTAKNDVHIALSAQNADINQMYEIVIGGWANTRSVVRRCKQCTNLVSVTRKSGFVNPNEFRSFWIEFDGGDIAVGFNGESAFMRYRDPSPLNVNYVGFSTGWLSRGNFRFCDLDCKNHETNLQYRYRYNLPRLPKCATRFEFSVRASNDVHIALSADDEDLDSMYEIVIGGWGDTKSVIRRCKQCANLVSYDRSSGFLDQNEYRRFWIQFVDGEIAVGYIGEVAFMTYQDPNPLDISYVGYSTGWGSSGSFQFCDIDCTYSSTDLQYKYRYNLPRVPNTVGRFEFSVKASNDVHIALSAQRRDLNAMYEIVIGGWSDTKSVIRRCKQCGNLASHDRRSGFLEADEYRHFWIEFVDGLISVGYFGEVAFMMYQDPKPLNVNYVGYSTGWGSNGRFRFCDIGCLHSVTDDQYRYRYNLPRVPDDVTRFEFSVRASNDVHIALSSQNRDLNSMYEIVIGGWGNTRSVIRRCKQCTNRVSYRSSDFLDLHEYRHFWIQFDDGVISVGYVGKAAFMTYTDPSPFEINFVGYSTGWGSNGSFLFCDNIWLGLF
ncbi:uncharacterized protein LOC117125080 [Anneissia japonica]|uniref:uncharacterized protein LOC117125080 n=1 Tax=Anneissia japonica TaxID=1529436 RepID=UPI00142578A1|nr:uncharacterized protein LOC117125080 [Anneissia japonica]